MKYNLICLIQKSFYSKNSSVFHIIFKFIFSTYNIINTNKMIQNINHGDYLVQSFQNFHPINSIWTNVQIELMPFKDFLLVSEYIFFYAFTLTFYLSISMLIKVLFLIIFFNSILYSLSPTLFSVTSSYSSFKSSESQFL